MLGLTFLLLASAADPAPAATTAPADPAPITSIRPGKYKLPPMPEGPDPMRRLIDAQNQSAPRNDGSGGMSGAEADLVMAHYLASIGKRLNPSDENVTQGSHR
jgi:hypothetical protein